MSSRNFIRLQTPTNYNNNQFRSKHNEVFSPMRKQKNSFGEYMNLNKKDKFVLKGPNYYRSFINSSAPFNYFKNPVDKSTFLVSYNGGPKNQLHTYVTREDLKPDFDENKEFVYKNVKPCIYQPKNKIPKLSRNLSYGENYNRARYNGMSNSFKNIEYLPENRLNRNISGFMSSKPLRMSKDGKIIFTLKKFNENKFPLNNNLRYEKKENESEKIMKIKPRFINSCFSFRPRIVKRFHKTQIFNLCKPFLVDEFQEFPD
jgi:hypothetical protein